MPSLRLRVTALIVIIMFLTATMPAFAFPINVDSDNYPPDRILVKFRGDVSASEMAQVHRRLGGSMEKNLSAIGVQSVAVAPGLAKAKAKAYAQNPMVLFAEPDYEMQATGTPNDVYFSKQWGLTKIEAEAAWNITSGSAGVKIAVLDTGIDLSHPDLAPKVVANANFSVSSYADDTFGHGTHAAGIAAAMTNNGIGTAGVGHNSSLMNGKVLGDDGYGLTSWIAQGIIWAADNGANVISMSLGGSTASSTLESAVNYAWNKGAVVVAAAGNSASSALAYPASYTNVIAVAATDSSDRLASYSNYGDWVDVAAPGSSIYSTYKDGSYAYMSGTSMAAPFVSGLAALAFSVSSDANGNGRVNDEVRARIENGCVNIGVAGIGKGRISAYRSLQGAVAPLPDPAPVPTTGDIEGLVTDADTGLPIQGAIVSCGAASITTDAAGHYALKGIATGSYALNASASNYTSASKAAIVTAGTSSTANFALTAIPPQAPAAIFAESITFVSTGKNLKVIVKIVGSNGPIAGATVSCLVTNSANQSWQLAGATDSTGSVSYSIARPVAGTYQATIKDVSAGGCIWDAASGVTSAAYTLGGTIKRK